VFETRAESETVRCPQGRASGLLPKRFPDQPYPDDNKNRKRMSSSAIIMSLPERWLETRP
jgi:hypothetical protein